MLWGFSLGTCPTVDVASRYSGLGGAILQSPLASVFIFLDDNVGWDFYESSGDSFASIYKIHMIRSPILIMHGKNDNTIKYKHSKLLYNKYINMNPNTKNRIQLLLIENIDHNNMSELIINQNSQTSLKIFNFMNGTQT